MISKFQSFVPPQKEVSRMAALLRVGICQLPFERESFFGQSQSQRAFCQSPSRNPEDQQTATSLDESSAESPQSQPSLSVSKEREKNMVMLFTCSVCEVRAAKAFSRHSYENGIVLVRCPGCSNLHLVADHLGWFGSGKTIEDILQSKGEAVVRKATADDSVFEISPEDIIGNSILGAIGNTG